MGQLKRRRSVGLLACYLESVLMLLLGVSTLAYIFLANWYLETGVPTWDQVETFLDVCACSLLPNSPEESSLRQVIYQFLTHDIEITLVFASILALLGGACLCSSLAVDFLSDHYNRSQAFRRMVFWAEWIALILGLYCALAIGYTSLDNAVRDTGIPDRQALDSIGDWCIYFLLPVHPEDSTFQGFLHKLFYLSQFSQIAAHYVTLVISDFILLSLIVLSIVCVRRANRSAHSPTAVPTPSPAPKSSHTEPAVAPAPSPSPKSPKPENNPVPPQFHFVENGNPFHVDPGVRVQHLAPSTSLRQDYVVPWQNGRISLDTIYPGGILTLVLTDGVAMIETSEGLISMPSHKPIVLRRVNDGGQEIVLAALTWLGGNVC